MRLLFFSSAMMTGSPSPAPPPPKGWGWGWFPAGDGLVRPRPVLDRFDRPVLRERPEEEDEEEEAVPEIRSWRIDWTLMASWYLSMRKWILLFPRYSVSSWATRFFSFSTSSGTA